MKHQNTSLCIAVTSLLALGSSVSSSHAAVTIAENFEGSSAGSGSAPSGWSLITATGSPTYATSNAGAGSNGSGGSSGLSGQVSSTTFLDAHLPGGYLINTTTLDLNFAVTGTFDFRIVNEAGFDDVGFMLGDIADGYDDTGADNSGTPGELLNIKMFEGTSEGKANIITNGYGRDNVGNDRAGELASNAIILADDTWYRATVTWNPTSGLTGDFNVTVNDFSSDLFTLGVTGFTFDSADGYIGFGSVNDTIAIDNINFTNSVPIPVPEPSSTVLLGLGGLALILRRRK